MLSFRTTPLGEESLFVFSWFDNGRFLASLGTRFQPEDLKPEGLGPSARNDSRKQKSLKRRWLPDSSKAGPSACAACVRHVYNRAADQRPRKSERSQKL
jgi:hypothetical protein